MTKYYKEYIKAYGIPEPTIVLPHLILGSKYDLYEKENFKKYNIKYILCCASECKHSDMDIPKGVILKHLPIEDDWKPELLESSPQNKNFEESVSFIDNALEEKSILNNDLNESTCYVHCMRGRSRSSSVVLAYLMLKQKMN